MTTYEWLQDKWKTREMQEKVQEKMPTFARSETLPIINEKARMRNLSYGKYVLAREQGLYAEDKYMDLSLNHEHRVAFMAHQKRK